MHHEIDKSQELLELTELIGLFGILLDVEPTLANIFKGDLNDFGQFTNPTLLTGVVTDVGDGLSLFLSELVNSAVVKCW